MGIYDLLTYSPAVTNREAIAKWVGSATCCALHVLPLHTTPLAIPFSLDRKRSDSLNPLISLQAQRIYVHL